VGEGGREKRTDGRSGQTAGAAGAGGGDVSAEACGGAWLRSWWKIREGERRMRRG
jgi:hypothetical protein